MNENTINFNNELSKELEKELNKDIKSNQLNIINEVYNSLKENGYNPMNQLVGYILSGDLTYITNHNNAREKISSIERDELLEEMLKKYLGK